MEDKANVEVQAGYFAQRQLSTEYAYNPQFQDCH